MTDAVYFGGTVAAEPAEVTITIKAITLTYESCIIQSEAELDAIMRARHSFHVDIPCLRLMSLLNGIKYEEKKISLPEDTKFAVITFVHENQFVYNKTANSFLSARFTFPPNLIDLQLRMPGRDGMVSKDGFKNLSTDDCQNEISLYSLWYEMYAEGLIDVDFAAFCPNPGTTNLKSYCQFIPVDFLKYPRVQNGDQLTTIMKYTDTLSVERWYMQVFCLVQRVLVKHGTEIVWEWVETSPISTI